MARTRIQMTISVDLDPVPGTFSTKESARDVVEKLLMDFVEHYNPTVVLQPEK